MTTLARQLVNDLCIEIDRLSNENRTLLSEIAALKCNTTMPVDINPPRALHPILEEVGHGSCHWCCSGSETAVESDASNFQIGSEAPVESYALHFQSDALPSNVEPKLLDMLQPTDSDDTCLDAGLKKLPNNGVDEMTSLVEGVEEDEVTRFLSEASAKKKAFAVKKALFKGPELESICRWQSEVMEMEEGNFSLRSFVTSAKFEAFFGFLIFMNAFCMALSSQYNGMDIGFDIAYQSYPNKASDTWRGAGVVLDNLELVFGGLFLFELLLKIAALRREFFWSAWNLFDAVVVASWLSVQAGAKAFLNPMLLRLMRLVRVVRLLRMVRNFELFDTLRIMIRSIGACLPVLLWAALVVFFVQVMVGLCLNNMFAHWIKDSSNLKDKREILFAYFGTFSRSMITMTELTFGNFVPVCRFMTENVDEWYGHLLIVYKFVVGFALVRVISGIFLLETFKAASSDDDLMRIQRKRAQKSHEKKMMLLFNQGAVDDHLSRADFVDLLQNKSVSTWLAAQEIDTRDANLLFDLMDDGNQRLSAPELINGLGRLKGTAKSLDLVGLMHMTAHLSWLVSEIDVRLQQQEIRASLRT